MINEIFKNIYKHNLWGGNESISGRGSDSDQTENIIKELPILFKEFNIKSILDIPCGDFNWMKHVDLNGIEYMGADIVEDIVESNKAKYKDFIFVQMDITEQVYPPVDLVLVRDCLVHMSYDDILDTLVNIYDSGSKYLLTTTFVDREENQDIKTGAWRPINLELPPFLLPKPIKIINEGCTQSKLAYADKSLGLWKI